MSDLHGEAGVSMRDIEADDDETMAALADEGGDTPAARWHGITAAPATDPLETGDDDGPEVPRAIRGYLLSDENDIIAVRLHGCLLLAPGVAALGGLLLAIGLNGLLYQSHDAAPGPVYTLWGLWLAVLAWAAYRWIEWRQTWFVVTGHRLLLAHATHVFGRDVSQLPIDKMRDVRLAQTVVGRAFGYGTLDFASIGTERALDVVNFLPYPEWLYREICALKMPDTERKVMVKRGPGTGR
jgi:Bacterial PH domain